MFLREGAMGIISRRVQYNIVTLMGKVDLNCLQGHYIMLSMRCSF